jgi:hypothetical protein
MSHAEFEAYARGAASIMDEVRGLLKDLEAQREAARVETREAGARIATLEAALKEVRQLAFSPSGAAYERHDMEEV